MQSFEHHIAQKLERFKTICREHNIKLTPQRLLIYEELIRSHEHPSTDMLYQKVKQTFPTISFDTVNRALLTFYDIGVAGLVEGTGKPKRFEGNLKPHHHFQCLRCKRIIDVYSEAYDQLEIPPDVQRQFTVFRQTVCLEGICDACRQKIAEQAES